VSLIHAFGIDDGELDHMTPQQRFVLGVEWGRVYELAKTRAPIDELIHSENEHRVVQMLKDEGYNPVARMIHDDWIVLQADPPYDL